MQLTSTSCLVSIFCSKNMDLESAKLLPSSDSESSISTAPTSFCQKQHETLVLIEIIFLMLIFILIFYQLMTSGLTEFFIFGHTKRSQLEQQSSPEIYQVIKY